MDSTSTNNNLRVHKYETPIVLIHFLHTHTPLTSSLLRVISYFQCIRIITNDCQIYKYIVYDRHLKQNSN